MKVKILKTILLVSQRTQQEAVEENKDTPMTISWGSARQ